MASWLTSPPWGPETPAAAGSPRGPLTVRNRAVRVSRAPAALRPGLRGNSVPGLRTGPGDTPVAPLHPQAGRQHGQHSRLQRSDEGVGVRSLWQLAALLPAQADDVTQSLRSVGLPLEKRGCTAHQGRASMPFHQHARLHCRPARRSRGAPCTAACTCDQAATDA